MLVASHFTLDERSALFLDFDGTLVELAPRPDDVLVAPDLVPLLGTLQQLLGGAVAVVTGRSIEQIDAYLSPLKLPVAGVHGAERRRDDGSITYTPHPDFGDWPQRLEQLAAANPGVALERKPGAMALHYRLAPECADLCNEAMDIAVAALPGLALMRGKMVVEIKPALATKALAIEAFLAEPPFQGRRPVFIGDDVTDESGFVAVQASGGAGIKVGAGESAAKHRLGSPAFVRSWLAAVGTVGAVHAGGAN